MHDCNYCGCACYCHGDIDDCPVETIEFAAEHCTGCGCEEQRLAEQDDLFEEDDGAGLMSPGGPVFPAAPSITEADIPY
jgi:hypothetical protein